MPLDTSDACAALARLSQPCVSHLFHPQPPSAPANACRRQPQSLGGGERDRTDDPLLAKQVLSQLSYTPTVIPAFVLLPFESTVSSTLKTIQCNLLKHEFVFYAALNRDRLGHFLCTP